MGSDDRRQGGQRQGDAHDNVVVRFPKNWIGPLDELVPIGPAADRAAAAASRAAAPASPEAAASRAAAPASQAAAGADPPTLCVEPPALSAEAFWSGEFGALHAVLQAPRRSGDGAGAAGPLDQAPGPHAVRSEGLAMRWRPAHRVNRFGLRRASARIAGGIVAALIVFAGVSAANSIFSVSATSRSSALARTAGKRAARSASEAIAAVDHRPGLTTSKRSRAAIARVKGSRATTIARVKRSPRGSALSAGHRVRRARSSGAYAAPAAGTAATELPAARSPSATQSHGSSSGAALGSHDSTVYASSQQTAPSNAHTVSEGPARASSSSSSTSGRSGGSSGSSVSSTSPLPVPGGPPSP